MRYEGKKRAKKEVDGNGIEVIGYHVTKTHRLPGSYKRLVGNFWTPVSVSWGVENRLGAVRVIVPPTTSPNGTRLEMVS